MAKPGPGLPGLLNDPSARRLVAGDLEAVFLPGHGMLGASLSHCGVEMLRRVEDLETLAAKGSTAGIPFLHPWANRLAGRNYSAAGHAVTLDTSSPLLHTDDHGLPIHGVPWSRLTWDVDETGPNYLTGRLDWDRHELLAVFPFRHRVELTATLGADSLTVETRLIAGSDGPVPISFGFHPYLGLPEPSRAQWRLKLPAMRKLALDPRGIPTGEEEPYDGFDAPLGTHDFDTGFALLDEPATLSIAGSSTRVSMELLAGYRYTQVFAPKDQNYIALEPMTAPTNALVSGQGLRLVEPGDSFYGTFRIRIEAG